MLSPAPTLMEVGGDYAPMCTLWAAVTGQHPVGWLRLSYYSWLRNPGSRGESLHLSGSGPHQVSTSIIVAFNGISVRVT